MEWKVIKEIILRCPLGDSFTVACKRTVKIRPDAGESNSPIWYTVAEGYEKMMSHIEGGHTLREFKTYFADNLATQIAGQREN